MTSNPQVRLESHLHPIPSFDVADFPLPSGREEVWRFAPIARFAELLREPVSPVAAPADSFDAPFGKGGAPEGGGGLFGEGRGANPRQAAPATPFEKGALSGQVAPATPFEKGALSGQAAAAIAFTYNMPVPDGVTFGTLAPGAGVRGSVLVPVDRAAALASAGAVAARHVRIAAGANLTQPVVLTFTGNGQRATEHLVIEAGEDSTAIVVVEHRGSALFLGNIEVVLHERAKLVLVSVQDWAADAVHGGMHAAAVGADAQYRHIMMTFGGDAVRLQNAVKYTGAGGSAELFGLYFTDAGQYQEHRLFVDQNAPHTVSRVDYRGALQGKGAHAVWVGDVLIRREAVGIDSYEANKNLVLTDGCRADSVPNLEIETGNIKGAGHSSTTGRFDDGQLFYLMSRGLDEAEARRLVVQGFFYDIIRRIGVPTIEEQLKHLVDAELNSEFATASDQG